VAECAYNYANRISKCGRPAQKAGQSISPKCLPPMCCRRAHRGEGAFGKAPVLHVDHIHHEEGSEGGCQAAFYTVQIGAPAANVLQTRPPRRGGIRKSAGSAC